MSYTEMTRRGYRSSEPDEMEREIDKVFAVLREEGTSQTDIATELAIPQNGIAEAGFRSSSLRSTAPAGAPSPRRARTDRDRWES